MNNVKKFLMSGPRTKKWCFTLNNYTQEQEEHIKDIECEYMIFGHEIAPSTGTRHLQGFIYFSQRRTMKTVKKLIGCDQVHLEAAGGTIQQNVDYCSKDHNDIFIKGNQPEEQSTAGGNATKRKWEEAISAAREGRFDDIPPDLWIRYRKSFKDEYTEKKQINVKEITTKIKDHFYWIHGPTGTGKSTLARRMANALCDEGEEPYLKQLNKWWNGYKMQKVVIIEEVSPNLCNIMSSYFKQWCDKWPFSAEVKGGSFDNGIRPEYIIITSNYSIDDCFEKEEDRLPMKRRITEIYKDSLQAYNTFTVVDGPEGPTGGIPETQTQALPPTQPTTPDPSQEAIIQDEMTRLTDKELREIFSEEY